MSGDEIIAKFVKEIMKEKEYTLKDILNVSTSDYCEGVIYYTDTFEILVRMAIEKEGSDLFVNYIVVFYLVCGFDEDHSLKQYLEYRGKQMIEGAKEKARVEVKNQVLARLGEPQWQQN